MQIDLYQKRIDLIIDYISQILIYGSHIHGNITIDKCPFEDGKYLVLTVQVVQNSYFRWHDLGILAKESLSFYPLILSTILDKFKDFNICFGDSNQISFSSLVNHNQINVSFTLTNSKEKNWFLKQKELFYNEDK